MCLLQIRMSAEPKHNKITISSLNFGKQDSRGSPMMATNNDHDGHNHDQLGEI